jgi:hypothetical protein
VAVEPINPGPWGDLRPGSSTTPSKGAVTLHMHAPTYHEFRTWALSQGYVPETLAPHVEADNPLKTAERVLVHLAGSTFDEQPLPYAKLCALYRGATVSSSAPSPKAHVELDETLILGRKDRSWLKPGQYTVTHDDYDPYLYVTLTPDSPREGIKTLAHLSGALRLGPDTYRFPYEVLCRLAGQQWRAKGDQLAESSPAARLSADAPAVPRLCSCGTPLTGRAHQRYCSPRCRVKACRANPQRIAKTRGVRSVTGMTTFPTPMKRFLGPARRADGSIRDVFSDLPAPALFARMGDDAREHNEWTILKAGYRELVHERPELFE